MGTKRVQISPMHFKDGLLTLIYENVEYGRRMIPLLEHHGTQREEELKDMVVE